MMEAQPAQSLLQTLCTKVKFETRVGVLQIEVEASLFDVCITSINDKSVLDRRMGELGERKTYGADTSRVYLLVQVYEEGHPMALRVEVAEQIAWTQWRELGTVIIDADSRVTAFNIGARLPCD